jgi:hypothetical protein
MYIELIASVSSELLFLSMQQVSTQKYSSPSNAACFAQNCIFLSNQPCSRSCSYPCPSSVLIVDLVFSPGMREYCVSRYFVTGRFAKDDLAVGFAMQEAYQRHIGGSQAISWQLRLVLVDIGANTANLASRHRADFAFVVVSAHKAVSWHDSARHMHGGRRQNGKDVRFYCNLQDRKLDKAVRCC